VERRHTGFPLYLRPQDSRVVALGRLGWNRTDARLTTAPCRAATAANCSRNARRGMNSARPVASGTSIAWKLGRGGRRYARLRSKLSGRTIPGSWAWSHSEPGGGIPPADGLVVLGLAYVQKPPSHSYTAGRRGFHTVHTVHIIRSTRVPLGSTAGNPMHYEAGWCRGGVVHPAGKGGGRRDP
jgi:hypothetical protein